jgi:hypothetical protein
MNDTWRALSSRTTAAGLADANSVAAKERRLPRQGISGGGNPLMRATRGAARAKTAGAIARK